MTSGSFDVIATVESAYHQHFETSPARASVSFVGVDPIEILAYRQNHPDQRRLTTYLSLGMSRYPMVPADSDVLTADGPRAELMLEVSGDSDDVWRRLAVLAAAPAVESVVYALDARIDLGEPWLAGSRCTGVIVTASPLLPVDIDGATVEIFQLIPTTQIELAWARIHGSRSLMERWQAAATDLTDLYRSPVELS